MAYDSINPAVIGLVPTTGVCTILDLGCGSGAMGARLKSALGCTVTGVTFDPDEASVAATRLDRVVTGDLNFMPLDDLGLFDCVVCSHVLEHLYRPSDVLVRIRANIAPGGALVVALPNVLFWRQRYSFLRGRFRYTSGGLMDSTHYRFFDWSTAQEMVSAAGFRIEDVVADGGFPLSRFLPLRERLDGLAVRMFPGLFGWQFVIRGRVA